MNKETEVLNIYLLQNSIDYFFESVFVLEYIHGFKLTVIHQGRVVFENLYKSIKGAMIAFSMKYNFKKWTTGTSPMWSRFVPPGEGL